MLLSRRFALSARGAVRWYVGECRLVPGTCSPFVYADGKYLHKILAASIANAFV